MRLVATVAAARVPWLAALALALAIPAASGAPGAVVPLLATSLLLAALALALVGSVLDVPDPAPARRAHDREVRTHAVLRSADPDAAGHARPRAPSRPVTTGR